MTAAPFEDVDPLAELEMTDEERRDLEFAREWNPDTPSLRFNPAIPARLAQIRADREAHEAALRDAVASSRQTPDEPGEELPPDDDHLRPWRRVDLGPVLRGEIHPVAPSILRRDDCLACFYAGRVNGLHADSAVGKSWVAAIAAAQELKDGRHVTWIDLEDPDPTTLIERLRLLRVTDEAIDERLHYHGPDIAFSTDAVDLIADDARAHSVTLIVIDSIGEAFGLEGLDENKDVETGRWLRRVARPLADTGAAVILIDHATKANDNPLHPSGSKRKRAAITGASYLVEAPQPLTREDGGRLRLICAKDRHGYHRQRARIADIEFSVYPDTGMTVHVWPPSSSSTSDTPDGRLDRAARAAVRATRDSDHPVGRNELEELMDFKAAARFKRAAIDRAIALGAIRTEPGPGRYGRPALLHHYINDLPTTEPTP